MNTPRKLLATTAAGLALFGGTTALAVSGFVGTASAQDSTATADAPARDGRLGNHPRVRRAIRGAVQTAAEAIGIDAKTLVQEAKGTSIAQVATNHGVDPQVVIDALVAKANARIDEAVANGKLTAEKAAEIKAKVPERVAKMVNHVFDGSHRPAR